MHRTGFVATVALAASACSSLPPPDGDIRERLQGAPYPTLLTVEEMVAIGPNDGENGEHFAPLERRADALRARTAGLRAPVPDRHAREDPLSPAERLQSTAD